MIQISYLSVQDGQDDPKAVDQGSPQFQYCGKCHFLTINPIFINILVLRIDTYLLWVNAWQ